MKSLPDVLLWCAAPEPQAAEDAGAPAHGEHGQPADDLQRNPPGDGAAADGRAAAADGAADEPHACDDDVPPALPLLLRLLLLAQRAPPPGARLSLTFSVRYAT